MERKLTLNLHGFLLFQGQTDVSAYIPEDTWYDYKNGSAIPFHGEWVTLSAPLDIINVHQRGGSIIPTQRDGITTEEARKLPFSLQVALDSKKEATGFLFCDDGETIGEKYSSNVNKGMLDVLR